MIEISGLCLSYHLGGEELVVLRNTDARIAPGEKVAVAGPSGSGKTSLLLLLSGLERPTAGGIIVDGVDIAGLDDDGVADLRRDRIGIVF